LLPYIYDGYSSLFGLSGNQAYTILLLYIVVLIVVDRQSIALQKVTTADVMVGYRPGLGGLRSIKPES
jgi:hypothetical protein